MNDKVRNAVNEMVRSATQRGCLIEVGFLACLIHSFKADEVPPVDSHEFEALRCFFFAGAQHLFGSLTGGDLLSPGAEITMDDERRMEMIDSELRQFITEFAKRSKLSMRPEEKLKTQ